MSRSFAALRAMPRDQLIAEHDRTAQSTQVGVSYYLDELARRDAQEQGDRMVVLTETMHRLTWAIAALTTVNVLAALALLFGYGSAAS